MSRDPHTGEFDQWVIDILQTFRNTYAEVSPSGTGCKLWVRGTLPISGSGKKNQRVEMYHHARFFTMTGEKLEEHPSVIADCQDAITTLFESQFVKPKKPVPQTSAKALTSGTPASKLNSAYKYLAKLPELRKHFNSVNIERLPRYAATGMCSTAEGAALNAAFTPLLPGIEGGERALRQQLETIQLCAALKTAQAGSWPVATVEPTR